MLARGESFRLIAGYIERRMAVKRLLLILVLVVLATAGCKHGPYAPSTYGPGKTSYEHTGKIIFADRSLRSDLKVVTIEGQPQPDGRLKVYAELENQTAKNLVIQVQTQFRDATGALSRDATNWRTIVMPPNSLTSYESTSMNDEAVDFIVRVKLEKRH